jgi:hypothetical protein
MVGDVTMGTKVRSLQWLNSADNLLLNNVSKLCELLFSRTSCI